MTAGAAATAGTSLDHTPVTALRGAGARIAERLAAIGIRTVGDLLFHLPLRFQDRTRVVPIGSLHPGVEVVVEGAVELAQVRFGRRRSLLVHVADGSGAVVLRFFHFSEAQQRGLARGARIRCFGEVRRGPASLEMVHPEYRLIEPGQEFEPEHTLTPIYPTTEGVSQTMMRRFTDQALERLDAGGGLRELLPAPMLEALSLPALGQALVDAHRPVAAPRSSGEDARPERRARLRLAFEELLAHQLSLRLLRERMRSLPAPRLVGDGSLVERFLASLPFELTAAQRRVIREIRADLASGHPMQRLTQGDVGSGKTVVAALAALEAIEAGHQAAVMAPTELLAEQHLTTFRGWLEPLGLVVAWLSGRQGARSRRSSGEAVERGDAAVAVGTHALFQEGVRFQRLGLVVVDEQHRFGVHQRLALREKGVGETGHPHQLIMTATPIPRTLAMTAYADLDTSVIDELPPGRTPVDTAVVSNARRAEVVERVHRACREGQQAYWVCPLIEESDALEAEAAAETAERLAAALPDLRVRLIHGRLKPAEKELIMGAFKAGEVELLVATTVIEVGVDVPNASLMIIENAERLGLAQLHQLRGRVGRGRRRSACVLLYQAPLTDTARARLEVLRRSNDGFEIAERDLEIRGPGEVLGTRQTGAVQMRIADVVEDEALLPMVRRTASELLERFPDRVEPIIARWIGDSVEYGKV